MAQQKYWLSAGHDPILVLSQDLKTCQAWISISGLQDQAYIPKGEINVMVRVRGQELAPLEFRDYFCRKILDDTWQNLIDDALSQEEQTNLNFLNVEAVKLL